MSRARNISSLSTVEVGATADQTKSDIEGLGIAASSVTGALPAISGASLTSLPVQQTDSGWITLTPYLENSWVQYSSGYAIRYRTIGKRVDINGLVKSGTDPHIITLPTALRPTIPVYFPIAAQSQGYGATSSSQVLYINTSGHFIADPYASNWTSIKCTYLLD